MKSKSLTSLDLMSPNNFDVAEGNLMAAEMFTSNSDNFETIRYMGTQ